MLPKQGMAFGFKRCKARQQEGLSLIEVMVALIIVTVALGAAIQTVGGGAVNEARIREQLMARWVASNRIATVRLERQWPKIGSTVGNSKMGRGDWEWTQTTEATLTETVRSIKVSVWRAGFKNDAPSAVLTAFIVK